MNVPLVFHFSEHMACCISNHNCTQSITVRFLAKACWTGWLGAAGCGTIFHYMTFHPGNLFFFFMMCRPDSSTKQISAHYCRLHVTIESFSIPLAYHCRVQLTIMDFSLLSYFLPCDRQYACLRRATITTHAQTDAHTHTHT